MPGSRSHNKSMTEPEIEPSSPKPQVSVLLKKVFLLTLLIADLNIFQLLPKLVLFPSVFLNAALRSPGPTSFQLPRLLFLWCASLGAFPGLFS